MAHQYQRSLSVVDDEIRLLQIQISRDPDPEVKCQLFTTPLGSAGKYIALSYCWGDPRIKGKIVVSGRPMMVTKNLISALQELRSRGYLRIWVDAACIDQNNQEECSQQILRMAGIYRSASKVVSFLHGATVTEAKLASALFRRIKDEDEEISTNTELEIIWGHHVFELKSLIRIARLASDLKGVGIYGQLAHIQNIDRIRTGQLTMQQHFILEVLPLTRITKASEPRDRIYAILGVTSNGNILVPVPNYSQSDSAVNRDITVRMIERTKSLDFVIFKHGAVGPWWHDWFSPESFSDRRMKCFIKSSNINESYSRYSDILYNASNKRLAEFEVRNNSLFVQGFFVDDIMQCSPALSEALQGGVKAYSWEYIHGGNHRIDLPERTMEKRSRILAWLFYGMNLHHDFSTSYRVDETTLEKLLYSLRKGRKMAHSNYVKELIQWLYCCCEESFDVEGYPLTSWLTGDEGPTSPKPNLKLRSLMKMHDNLKLQMRLGSTDHGRMGWFNRNALPGDKVAVISGCRFPAVLRECGENRYCVVGEAVVRGLMFGEALRKAQPTLIKLVELPHTR
ncbi:unnamed protein product [Clonostachys rosea]|uniref:Heterokaryon incompatibility domain-containing protein n=1 Tax=Bionectria ochroleuca TaxID=29856 RepID=A0ABY6TUI6_BIOOC|nr:unnamed protein product [Clonostachys rosea]